MNEGQNRMIETHCFNETYIQIKKTAIHQLKHAMKTVNKILKTKVSFEQFSIFFSARPFLEAIEKPTIAAVS